MAKTFQKFPAIVVFTVLALATWAALEQIGLLYFIFSEDCGDKAHSYLRLEWRHDTQHNYNQHNDFQHNDSQHNNSQHNNTQHNDTQHNDTQHNNK